MPTDGWVRGGVDMGGVVCLGVGDAYFFAPGGGEWIFTTKTELGISNSEFFFNFCIDR